MRTLHLTIRGKVQGVGFRAHVLEAAAVHGVHGWVRNAPNGSVEIAAQGRVEPFLDDVRRGPRWARVDAVETDEVEERPYRRFEVRF